MDELRFRSQQSPPRTETTSTMNSFVSPPRPAGRQLPQPVSSSSHDSRSGLPRRFTTDSGRVPTLSSIITQQRGPEPLPDLSAATVRRDPFPQAGRPLAIVVRACAMLSLCRVWPRVRSPPDMSGIGRGPRRTVPANVDRCRHCTEHSW